jgi:hypothetical protein
MKFLIKTASVFITLSLIMSCVLSCTVNDQDSDNITTANITNIIISESSGQDSVELYDLNGYWKDDLPADLDFGDYQFTIYRWTDVEHEEFKVKDMTGETVNDAIWNRNRVVEERLKIKLNFIGSPGNSSNINAFTTNVQNIILAGTQDFDVVAAYSMTIASLASKDVLFNLLDCEYLNFSQPWWPERLTSETTRCI